MAVYKELDTSMYDGVAILENAAYMAQNINIARNIPVMETHSGYVAKFQDVSTFAEEYGISYLDALTSIAEVNNIIPEMMHVGIDEADIICDPTLINLFEDSSRDSSVVWINPISTNSLAYKFCESMLESYIETDDEDYLLTIVDEEVEYGYGWLTQTIQNARAQKDKDNYIALKQAVQKGDTAAANELKKRLANSGKIPNQNVEEIEKNMNKYNSSFGHKKDVAISKTKTAGKNALQFAKDNKGKLAAGAALGIAAGGALAYKKYNDNQMKQLATIQHQMANAPKSWIAKKIAALRGLYSSYIRKANMAKATGQASVFQKVASKILTVIDALMKKMQSLAG